MMRIPKNDLGSGQALSFPFQEGDKVYGPKRTVQKSKLISYA